MSPESTPSRSGAARIVDALLTSSAAACGLALLLAAGLQLTRPVAIEPPADPVQRASTAGVAPARAASVIAIRLAARRPKPHAIAWIRGAVRQPPSLETQRFERTTKAVRPRFAVGRAAPHVGVVEPARAVGGSRTPPAFRVTSPRTRRSPSSPKRRFVPRSFSQATFEPPLGYDPMPEFTRAVAAPAGSIGTALDGVRVRGRDIAPAIPTTPTTHPSG